MYVFKRDGQEVAAQEWPVWVQLQENGCYGLCEAADAQGVVLGGKVYSLSNRTPMEGTEEVAAEIVESVPYLREKVDTLESRLAVQTAATEVAFVTLGEEGYITEINTLRTAKSIVGEQASSEAYLAAYLEKLNNPAEENGGEAE